MVMLFRLVSQVTVAGSVAVLLGIPWFGCSQEYAVIQAREKDHQQARRDAAIETYRDCLAKYDQSHCAAYARPAEESAEMALQQRTNAEVCIREKHTGQVVCGEPLPK